METLNLSGTRGYGTGARASHRNNQIASPLRSARHALDIYCN